MLFMKSGFRERKLTPVVIQVPEEVFIGDADWVVEQAKTEFLKIRFKGYQNPCQPFVSRQCGGGFHAVMVKDQQAGAFAFFIAATVIEFILNDEPVFLNMQRGAAAGRADQPVFGADCPPVNLIPGPEHFSTGILYQF